MGPDAEAEEGAEKVVIREKIPSAAKADVVSRTFAAWLKPRPFKTGGFSAASEALAYVEANAMQYRSV